MRVVAVSDEFTDFAVSAQPRLRLALGAAFGFDNADEATADVLSFAWEHWDQVSQTENPVGYLFAVGRNRLRRGRRRRMPALPLVRPTEMPWIEPGLPTALAHLSERQRAVVMLLHCFEWSLAEVAALLGISKGSVQMHERRGLKRLRRDLGCSDD